ncbi:hypothetical protein FBU30_003832 [Linnemannia zychae]|nr:hypothetical protein FBU30_003832 [Linnemannia zychae]
MKSRFGRERAPANLPTSIPIISSDTPSSSSRGSRPRNHPIPSESITDNMSASVTVGGGILATTAASVRKKLNRRSLSADNTLSCQTGSRVEKTQARKLAKRGVSENSSRGGAEDVSVGMSAHFTCSAVGGSLLRPPRSRAEEEDAVMFQNEQDDTLSHLHQSHQGVVNKHSKNKIAHADSRADIMSDIIASTVGDTGNDRDNNSGASNLATVGELTMISNSSVDLDSVSNSNDDINPGGSSNHSIDEGQQILDRPHKHQLTKQRQNSAERNSTEHVRSELHDEFLDLNSKIPRRKSDSNLLLPVSTISNSQDCGIPPQTSLALEDLEKEIDTLKSMDALLKQNYISTPASIDHIVEPTNSQRKLRPSRREAKILLVSSSALPTQYYDSNRTRDVLRTYLTSPGLEFDEMIEYGFPSEAFMNDSKDDYLDFGTEDLLSQQTEVAPSCRFLTLRITLTPWHARANESTLYGSSATGGRQLQFKAMVNRFFTKTNVATTAMIAAPLSTPSSLLPVDDNNSTINSPKMNPSGYQVPTDHHEQSICPLTTAPPFLSNRTSPKIGRRLFSPASSPPSSQIPVLVTATGSPSQPPRKGSFTALSLPLNPQQQQSFIPVTAPIIPPRRKGSTPALFFTPPSSGTHLMPNREMCPSPPRRPSDQSDSISANLASARGLNRIGGNNSNGFEHHNQLTFPASIQLEKARPLDVKSKRQIRHPNSIHIKRSAATSVTSFTSHEINRSHQDLSHQSHQGTNNRPDNHESSYTAALSVPNNNAISKKKANVDNSIGSNSSHSASNKHQHRYQSPESEELIYESMRKNPNSQTGQRTSSKSEKSCHPLQTTSLLPSHSPRLLGSQVRDIGNDGKGNGDTLFLTPIASTVMTSSERAPSSATPPRIQAKNQRRRGGNGLYSSPSSNQDIYSSSIPRAVPMSDRTHLPKYNSSPHQHQPQFQSKLRLYENRKEDGVENETDKCEVHIEDISFEGPPVDYYHQENRVSDELDRYTKNTHI